MPLDLHDLEISLQDIITNKYLHVFLVVCLFYLLRKYVVIKTFAFIERILNRDGTETCERRLLITETFNAIRYSFRNIVFVIGLMLATFLVQMNARLESIAFNILQSIIVFLLGYAAYKALRVLRDNIPTLHLMAGQRVDRILIEFAIKIGVGLAIITTLLLILQQWGIEVSTLIAGLGIGGLAFALAARDLVANIFAGIVVITDKPYSIGDWIEAPSAEGTVEEISFRSTRIRTFANALVTVPNSKLVDNEIQNWSRMKKRRISFDLGVTYSTTEAQMRTVVSDIETMLKEHPDIHKDVIFVRFNSFNASSLDIMIYCFTTTTVWGEYLKVREDVLLKIMNILEDEGVSVAFPSRSLYIQNKQESAIDKGKAAASVA